MINKSTLESCLSFFIKCDMDKFVALILKKMKLKEIKKFKDENGNNIFHLMAKNGSYGNKTLRLFCHTFKQHDWKQQINAENYYRKKPIFYLLQEKKINVNSLKIFIALQARISKKDFSTKDDINLIIILKKELKDSTKFFAFFRKNENIVRQKFLDNVSIVNDNSKIILFPNLKNKTEEYHRIINSSQKFLQLNGNNLNEEGRKYQEVIINLNVFKIKFSKIQQTISLSLNNFLENLVNDESWEKEMQQILPEVEKYGECWKVLENTCTDLDSIVKYLIKYHGLKNHSNTFEISKKFDEIYSTTFASIKLNYVLESLKKVNEKFLTEKISFSEENSDIKQSQPQQQLSEESKKISEDKSAEELDKDNVVNSLDKEILSSTSEENSDIKQSQPQQHLSEESKKSSEEKSAEELVKDNVVNSLDEEILSSTSEENSDIKQSQPQQHLSEESKKTLEDKSAEEFNIENPEENSDIKQSPWQESNCKNKDEIWLNNTLNLTKENWYQNNDSWREPLDFPYELASWVDDKKKLYEVKGKGDCLALSLIFAVLVPLLNDKLKFIEEAKILFPELPCRYKSYDELYGYFDKIIKEQKDEDVNPLILAVREIWGNDIEKDKNINMFLSSHDNDKVDMKSEVTKEVYIENLKSLGFWCGETEIDKFAKRLNIKVSVTYEKDNSDLKNVTYGVTHFPLGTELKINPRYKIDLLHVNRCHYQYFAEKKHYLALKHDDALVNPEINFNRDLKSSSQPQLGFQQNQVQQQF